MWQGTFIGITYARPAMFVQDKKFRTLSVDNFVRKWRWLH